MKVVIDPSVFVSALIGGEEAAPRLVMDALANEDIDAVVCPILITELEGVLARAKFAARVTQEQRAAYLARIHEQASMAPDPEPRARVLRDPDDDYLVALAEAENADAIISVDRDLLDAELGHPPTFDSAAATRHADAARGVTSSTLEGSWSHP